MSNYQKQALICFYGLLALFPAVIKAEVSERTLQSIYQFLDQMPIDGPMPQDADFESLSEQDQASVLADIIERAATVPKERAVFMHSMGMATSQRFADQTKSWNNRLQGVFLAQAKNPDSEARKILIELLFLQKKASDRELILSFLKDEDDGVRQCAISGMFDNKWPDLKSLCENYIQKTERNGEYMGSLVAAKRITNAADVQRWEDLTAMATGKPHPLERFSSYIALHKADPDYDFSVYEAEAWEKNIQGDLDFVKSQPEYKLAKDGVSVNPKVTGKYGAIGEAEMDDWGNLSAINGDIQYGRYGTYQLKLRGGTRSGIIRASWDWKKDYKFRITKIEEIGPDDSATTLWSAQ